jgi:hypothetical protein
MRRASALVLISVLLAPPPAGGETGTIAWQDPVEIAAGRGVRGAWRQNESDFDYVDDPTVALDGRGGAAVAWVDQAHKDVFFQRIGADGREPARPVNVSRNPDTFSWLPRVVLGPDGSVYLLWQEIIFSGGSHGGDVLFARSGDGGRTFSQPLNLSNSVAGDGKGRLDAKRWDNGSLDLAVGPTGALFAAWTEYDGPLWVSRSSDGGASFSAPAHIAGNDGEPARGPTLAVGPDRTVHLAWTVGESASADIRLASSRDGGASFGPARQVARTRGYSDAPKLAVDGKGVLHLAFSESAGGPFERGDVLYTRSRDGGHSFEVPRTLSQPAAIAGTGAGFPQLQLDAAGRVVVSWELMHDRRPDVRGLGIAISPDGGTSFTRPEMVPGSIDAAGGTNGSHQGLLTRKLAVDGTGAVALVNSSLAPGRHSRAWLMRGRIER